MDTINSKVSMNNISLPSAKILTPKTEDNKSISDGFTKQEPIEKAPDLSRKSPMFSKIKENLQFASATLFTAVTCATLAAACSAGLVMGVGIALAVAKAVF